MKNFKRIISVFLPVRCLFAMVFAACGGDDKDYGKLTVYKIENLAVGQSQQINYVFSDANYAGEITYTFEGNDIKIENNTVTALVGGKKIMVTAKTQYHETVFAVFTVAAPDVESKLVTNTVNCWLGYPAAPLDIYFTDDYEKNSAIYEYDTSAMYIDATELTVLPRKTGSYTVKLETVYKQTEFVVNIKEVSKVGREWEPFGEDTAETIDTLLEHYGTANTTLFIGDSFFDPWFFNNFNTIYKNKDAICRGIGSTTTLHWEQYITKGLLTFKTKPKNIALNLGTNNMYNFGATGAVAAESMERFLMLLRCTLPNTQIYLFSVAPREMNSDPSQTKINEFNGIISEFCKNREEITFIDVFEDMKTKIDTDNIHPIKSAYIDVYAQKLADAGCVIADRKK